MGAHWIYTSCRHLFRVSFLRKAGALWHCINKDLRSRDLCSLALKGLNCGGRSVSSWSVSREAEWIQRYKKKTCPKMPVSERDVAPHETHAALCGASENMWLFLTMFWPIPKRIYRVNWVFNVLRTRSNGNTYLTMIPCWWTANTLSSKQKAISPMLAAALSCAWPCVSLMTFVHLVTSNVFVMSTYVVSFTYSWWIHVIVWYYTFVILLCLCERFVFFSATVTFCLTKMCWHIPSIVLCCTL